MKKLLIYLLFYTVFIPLSTFAETTAVDNPFGPNVYIFDPSMATSSINNVVQQIYNQQQNNDFGDQRYHFLFMPGQYGQDSPLDVRVGFYTAVSGVGATPNDVVIKGAVRNQDRPGGSGATMLFWRSIENLSIIPTLGSITDGNIPKDQNVWACSQGAPLRRLRILNGSLRLYDVSWSSGGFLADSRIDKTIFSGTQQQWLTRNSTFGNWNGQNWNIVFVGTLGQIPGGNWPNPPYTIVEKAPLIKEKPYLYFDKVSNQWVVNVRTRRRNIAGTDWHIAGTNVPISKFTIVKPGMTATDMNAALAAGKHLLITPGVYHLTDTVNVTRAGTIIYGMGYATFVSDTGKPVISVSDVQSVMISGIMVDGGPVSAPTLFQVGTTVNNATHVDPVFIYDIFCRIGGPNSYRSTATSCMTINSNDVVLDNTWFWRADHGSNVGWTINKSDNGLIVNGKNVIVYNLMAEHHQKYNVLWNGDGGIMFEFQNEPPYDVPNQDAWKDGNMNGYAQYKVSSNVISHTAYALGVYTNFNNNVKLDVAIAAPEVKGVTLWHMLGFWLNGNGGSGFTHILNNYGCGVSQGNRFCTLVKSPWS